jgi:chromosome segregation ATPase
VNPFYSRPADIHLSSAEKSKVEEFNARLTERVQKLREDQRTAQANTSHQEYLKQLGPLEDEVKKLIAEKDSWENVVAGGIEGLKADIGRSKEETSTLVDNIHTIEGQLKSLLNGDAQVMEQIRHACYGALYVEGEGLPEIVGL